MQKLVSKNPIQRFKQGKKILKAQFGLGVPTTYNSFGQYIQKSFDNFYDNKLMEQRRKEKQQQQKQQSSTNKEIIPLGGIQKLVSNHEHNIALSRMKNSNKLQPSSTKQTIKSKPRSGWSYGFDRSKEGIGDIATMQRKLKAEGYYAADENSRDDGKWGQSTENAYKRYLAKQKAMELPPEVKVPTVPSVSSPTITPEQSKLNRSVISAPIHLNGLPKVLKENLGKNNNYNGLVNLIWGENDPNHILGGFSSDIKNMFSQYKTKQDWLDNQSAIEKALNISGRYRGTRGGDFGDLIRALATYNGIKDYEVDKFNNSLKHKSGGQLVSRNPIVRFKQGSSFGKAFREARAAGLKEFEWNGKKYHTRTKEEEEARKKQPSANKKVTVYTPSGKKETTQTDSTENKKPTYTPSDSIKNKKLFVPK